MNPTNFEQPGLSLPEPVSPAETVSKTVEKTPEKPHEVAATQPATPSAGSVPLPTPFFTTDPSGAPMQPVMTTPAVAAVPQMADDSDLIEKEWVTRAKAIVEKTKEDPHEQASELSSFKADYLKRRYNKDIKVSEN